MKWWLRIQLSVTAVFYLRCLPRHVQGGDTGELVAAAYQHLVAHPPGYGLWVWLMHAWTHLLPFESIFWRAALLTSFFSLAALGLLARALRPQLWLASLTIGLLAFSTSFREAALLPDVFSLHALLASALLSLFFFCEDRTTRARQFGVPALFFLGLAHHPTFVCLAPLPMAVFWEQRRAPRQILLGAGAGLLAFLIAQLSLLGLRGGDPFSWGFTSPWAHFFRLDYGALSLAPQGENLSRLAPLLDFCARSLGEILPLWLPALYFLWRQPKLRRLAGVRAGIATVLCCLAFFLFANVNPVGLGAEVLLRFHLLPIILIATGSAFLLSRAEFTPRAKRITLGLGALTMATLIWSALPLRKLRNDAIFENYAQNLLTQAEARAPAVVLAENDHAYFSLRYVQSVLGRGANVAVVAPSLFFHPWYLEKVRGRLPAFHLANAERIWEQRELDIETDIVRPNLDRVGLLVSRAFTANWKTTFLPLGRLLNSGAGTEFSSGPSSLLIDTRLDGSENGPQAFGKKMLFAQYAHFDLARGIDALRRGEPGIAQEHWERALDKVPYALPALQNLCQLRGAADPRCQANNLEEIARRGAGFF